MKSVWIEFTDELKCSETIEIDQGLFSVLALVFELARITSQKRFDGRYVIFEPSTSVKLW